MQRRFGRDGLEEANLRQRLALLYIQIDRPTDSAREYDLARRIEMVALRPQLEPTEPVLDACITGMVRMLTLGGRVLAANDDRSTVGLGVGAFNLVRHSALAATPGLGYLRIRSDGGALAAHRMPVAAAVV